MIRNNMQFSSCVNLLVECRTVIVANHTRVFLLAAFLKMIQIPPPPPRSK